ncbi:MAG: hypothetical protein WC314_08165 [Vulcanimicrobiota bacterium]
MFLAPLHYDCVQCSKGCRVDFTIPVQPQVEAGMHDSECGRALQREGYVPVRVLENGVKTMSRRPDGSCVLLRPDGLCAIHAEKGFQAKPRPCRQFPFHPINTPDGFYIGLSFMCTAVQKDLGRPLEEQRAEIEHAVSELFLEVPPEPVTDLLIPIAVDSKVSWPEYLEIERYVSEALNMKEEGLLDALWCTTARLGLAFLQHLNDETPFALSTLDITASPPLQFAEPALEYAAANLVAIVETADGEERVGMVESYLVGEAFHSDRCERAMRATPGRHVPPWFDGEVRRYFQHVLFRKFLSNGPILARMFSLCSLYRVLRHYTLDSAAQQQREHPVLEDYYAALDVVEVELMLHADGLTPFYDHLAYLCLNVLDPG